MEYIRKIKCPRHFLLRPGAYPFQREIIPEMAQVPDWAYKKWPTLRKERIKRDKRGVPIYDRKAYYQPEVTASFAIEHIYDPKNPICAYQCKKRCMEGKGRVIETGIKRLNG